VLERGPSRQGRAIGAVGRQLCRSRLGGETLPSSRICQVDRYGVAVQVEGKVWTVVRVPHKSVERRSYARRSGTYALVVVLLALVTLYPTQAFLCSPRLYPSCSAFPSRPGSADSLDVPLETLSGSLLWLCDDGLLGSGWTEMTGSDVSRQQVASWIMAESQNRRIELLR
jgi:hypothetical protein